MAMISNPEPLILNPTRDTKRKNTQITTIHAILETSTTIPEEWSNVTWIDQSRSSTTFAFQSSLQQSSSSTTSALKEPSSSTTQEPMYADTSNSQPDAGARGAETTSAGLQEPGST
eukprot:712865-Hanusia_phi.AAC.2